MAQQRTCCWASTLLHISKRHIMNKNIRIGIIGDFDSSRESQIKTNEALSHASNRLSTKLYLDWIPTKSLNTATLGSKIILFDAIWAGPGDYENPNGVMNAIRYCRDEGIPFLGT